MLWWPPVLGPWISVGCIDVDRMEQGAIQVGQNLSPRNGGGGGGSSITLVNAAGDFANSVVFNGYVTSTSPGQGGGGAQGGGAGVQGSAVPRPAPVITPAPPPGQVYTFRFQGSDACQSQPERPRRKSRRK